MDWSMLARIDNARSLEAGESAALAVCCEPDQWRRW